MTTPIEDRIAWLIHRTAVIAARALGICWWCAQLAGFAATNAPPSIADLCPKCRAAHPLQPATAEVSSCR